VIDSAIIAVLGSFVAKVGTRSGWVCGRLPSPVTIGSKPFRGPARAHLFGEYRMAKDKPPPLPYTRFSYEDFFNDPSVVKMTNEEVGAYMRLLRVCWCSTPPGHLPDDDDYLSVVSGMGESWLGHRSAMANAFEVKRGKWIQRRVVREYEHCRGLSEVRSRAGRKGAALLWLGHGSAIAKPRPKMTELEREGEKEKKDFPPAFTDSTPHKVGER
jgi:uncharacterized protein YdaU (DUF1376 family)